MDSVRLDYKIIYDAIRPDSRVLDLGCGDGQLLEFLVKEKNVNAFGVELNEQAIYECVAKGISVFHGDIESGLVEYPDKSFDYVILNQSMQEVKKVGYVLAESLRVGKQVIVGFPNFAYITSRLSLFFKGKAPITASLPYRWHNTPNVHFLSISDFEGFCREENIKVNAVYPLGKTKPIKFWPNLLALNAIFLIQKEDKSAASGQRP